MKSSELLGQKVKINQFRNIIYEMILFLKNKIKLNNEEIKDHLKDIAIKIITHYKHYWIPRSQNEIEIIKEIHEFIFKKKVKIKLREELKEDLPGDLIVIDKDCCFCKYERLDVGEIPGCIITVTVIEELFKIISKENSTIPLIKGEVIKSKTFGDKKCYHSYIILRRN